MSVTAIELVALFASTQWKWQLPFTPAFVCRRAERSIGNWRHTNGQRGATAGASAARALRRTGSFALVSLHNGKICYKCAMFYTHTHSHTAAVVETKSARKVAALHQLASSTGRQSWLAAKCGPKVR